MRRLSLVGLLTLVLLLCGGVALRVAAAPAARSPAPLSPDSPGPAPSCPPGWQVVPSPNSGANANFLNDVVALAPADVWAVGSAGAQTLTEHWDGTQWTIVPSPNSGTDANTLYTVAAVASTDIWAAGSAGSQTTLIEHWDGNQWTVVPSPGRNGWSGLAAVTANDIWAVGDGGAVPQAAHWDGTSWQLVPCPRPFTSAFARARGASDRRCLGGGGGPDGPTLIEHWDGAQWSVVSSPSPGRHSHLWGVAAIAANDVWAAGSYFDLTNNRLQPLLEHWNGTQWRVTASPNIPSADKRYAVVAGAATDVWAVGTTLQGPQDQPLVLHWDGSQWSVSASPALLNSDLGGVTRVGATDLWAVGSTWPGGPLPDVTLVEHYSTVCPYTPTATPTRTPVSPSPTPTTTPTITLTFPPPPVCSSWQPVADPPGQLNAVAMVAPDDVWAVGYSGGWLAEAPLVMHWDGQTWQAVPIPSFFTQGNNSFTGVVALAPADVWAVGTYTADNGDLPAPDLHWDGQAWSLVPCPYPAAYNNSLNGIAAGAGRSGPWAALTASSSLSTGTAANGAWPPRCPATSAGWRSSGRTTSGRLTPP